MTRMFSRFAATFERFATKCQGAARDGPDPARSVADANVSEPAWRWGS
ncbi:hypothetical protein SAMN05216466_10830 [Paraburkholderia phenazinium]|jgi:hypothetical protein|uniref:Uncharacterized protein n=1 Tax=Paraburkholderia phenazinium TaxID=60549 RepID=A0A1G8ANN3_9BURK|nr:hypothetical protein SAMN05216466_10830 [Paraburkholderia phenazinium]